MSRRLFAPLVSTESCQIALRLRPREGATSIVDESINSSSTRKPSGGYVATFELCSGGVGPPKAKIARPRVSVYIRRGDSASLSRSSPTAYPDEECACLRRCSFRHRCWRRLSRSGCVRVSPSLRRSLSMGVNRRQRHDSRLAPHRGSFVAWRWIRGRPSIAPRRPRHLGGGITARRSVAVGSADHVHLSVPRCGTTFRAHWRLSQPRVRYQRRNRMCTRSLRRTVLLPGRQFAR